MLFTVFYIPYTLEFQIVDGHDGLDPPEEFVLLEGIMQVHRNQTGLPSHGSG